MESESAQQQPPRAPIDRFKVLRPDVLKELLATGLSTNVQSVLLFASLEGSILAKAGIEEDTHSQAAVLACISHEYMQFGQEAFVDNKLKYLILEHDTLSFVARPVYNLVLCFVCDKNANLGLIRKKVETMGTQLENTLEPLKQHLRNEEEEAGPGGEEQYME